MRKMNRRMKGNDYILCKGNNNTKTPTPKRSKKHNMTQIPIAQLCNTTLTMTQTFQLAVHQTYRTLSWMKPLFIQKQKSHFHQMKMKLKHKYKPKKIQEDNTERDRQQSGEQNKCINTGQGNSHSK